MHFKLLTGTLLASLAIAEPLPVRKRDASQDPAAISVQLGSIIGQGYSVIAGLEGPLVNTHGRNNLVTRISAAAATVVVSAGRPTVPTSTVVATKLSVNLPGVGVPKVNTLGSLIPTLVTRPSVSLPSVPTKVVGAASLKQGLPAISVLSGLSPASVTNVVLSNTMIVVANGKLSTGLPTVNPLSGTATARFRLPSFRFLTRFGNALGGDIVARTEPVKLSSGVPSRTAQKAVSTATNTSSTVVAIPVATVCPRQSRGARETAFVPVSVSNSTATKAKAAASSSVILLPDGVTALPLPLGLNLTNVARFQVGVDGCQTLFVPTSTAICSTVVTPGGLPPVTISKCDQYVTFSSETAFTCAPTETSPVGHTKEKRDPKIDMITVATRPQVKIAGANLKREAEPESVIVHPTVLPGQFAASTKTPLSLPITTVTVSAPTSTTIIHLNITSETHAVDDSILKLNQKHNDNANAAAYSPPQPTVYYAAPFAEIARGGVPTHVREIKCTGGVVPDPTDPARCRTTTELWSVSTLSVTKHVTSTISFSGPAVYNSGNFTTTTTVDFLTTSTSTLVSKTLLVVRSTIGSDRMDPTTTIAVTKIPTQTLSVSRMDVPTTTYETSTLLQTVTVAGPSEMSTIGL